MSRLFPNEVILGKRFPLVIVAAATDHDANDHNDANQDDDGFSSLGVPAHSPKTPKQGLPSL